MANLKDRISLVTGTDPNQRSLVIENIKKKLLQKGLSPLDVINFYAKEIEIKVLQEKIVTFSFRREKVVILKSAANLTKDVTGFLYANLNKILSANYLIVEFEKDYYEVIRDKKISNDKFLSFVLKNALLYKVRGQNKRISFEDFKRSIRSNNLPSSFYILGKLFESKNSDSEKKTLGLVIFGILVNEVSNLANTLIKEKYLHYLWQADRAIKERGQDPRLVIELFLSKVLTA
jgi:hypothetical protein